VALDTSSIDTAVNGDGAAPAALVALASVGLVVRLSEVPHALAQPESDASETLSGLIAGGWVELWLQRGSVALTPSAAARLGLRLPPPPAPKRPWRRRERPESDVFGENGGLDRLADPKALDPADAVARWDRLPVPVRGIDPRPLRLLGMNVNPWLPHRPRRQKCPGCQGRKLAPIEVCLIEDCLRCGSDARIGRPLPEEMPRRRGGDGLGGGTGPAATPRADRPAPRGAPPRPPPRGPIP
jgi:hypothetical protein